MIVNTENTDLLVQQTQSTEQDVNEKKVDNQLQKSIKAEKKDPTDPPKK